MGLSVILHTFLVGVADLLQSGLEDLSLDQLLLPLLPLLIDRPFLKGEALLWLLLLCLLFLLL